MYIRTMDMSCQIPYAYGRVGGVCQILGLPKYMKIAPNLVKLLLQISTASFHLVFHACHISTRVLVWFNIVSFIHPSCGFGKGKYF